MFDNDLKANWGVKHLHGLKWGIHINTTDDYRVKSATQGGAYARLRDQDLNNIPKHNKHLLIFGNIWANKHEAPVFHNPDVLRQLRHKYVFWDNPALPHLLYKGPWNPEGYKNWCRMCWDHINPTPHHKPANTEGATRINRLLAQASDGKIDHWHQLIGGHPKDTKINQNVLLVPSSPEWHLYYQGIGVNEWLNERSNYLRNEGFDIHIRRKPSRQDREGDVGKLYEYIQEKNIGLVVAEGVGALEAILAGVPAIVGDYAPTGPLAITWDQYRAGVPVDTPTADRVDEWMERVLQDTFHKSEIYSGSWNG